MAKTTWLDCSPNGCCAFINDYLIYVCQSGDNWNWGADYYDEIVQGVCRTERGAKYAASRWAKKH